MNLFTCGMLHSFPGGYVGPPRPNIYFKHAAGIKLGVSQLRFHDGIISHPANTWKLFGIWPNLKTVRVVSSYELYKVALVYSQYT